MCVRKVAAGSCLYEDCEYPPPRSEDDDRSAPKVDMPSGLGREKSGTSMMVELE